jgi:hypothetical protein
VIEYPCFGDSNRRIRSCDAFSFMCLMDERKQVLRSHLYSMVLGPIPVIMSAAETNRSNIVLLFADDQRPDSIEAFESGQSG